jgi:hypothetical protein
MMQPYRGQGWRISLAGFMIAIAGTLAAGCGSHESPAASPAYAFTCCSADLGANVWHPGQKLHVSWTVMRVPGGSASAKSSSTLTLLLTGPYRTVSALKSAIAGSSSATEPGGRVPVATAPKIRAIARAGSAAVSVLVIPSNAPAGLYNLQFGVASGGSSNWGSTIIRVST